MDNTWEVGVLPGGPEEFYGNDDIPRWVIRTSDPNDYSFWECVDHPYQFASVPVWVIVATVSAMLASTTGFLFTYVEWWRSLPPEKAITLLLLVACTSGAAVGLAAYCIAKYINWKTAEQNRREKMQSLRELGYHDLCVGSVATPDNVTEDTRYVIVPNGVNSPAELEEFLNK